MGNCADPCAQDRRGTRTKMGTLFCDLHRRYRSRRTCSAKKSSWIPGITALPRRHPSAYSFPAGRPACRRLRRISCVPPPKTCECYCASFGRIARWGFGTAVARGESADTSNNESSGLAAAGRKSPKEDVADRLCCRVDTVLH